MIPLPKKQKRIIYKLLTVDEVISVSNEPWKMTLTKLLRNHNKLVRNFNQLLAHLLTQEDNHPEISYQGQEYGVIHVDEMSKMTLTQPPDQLLTKQFLRQLGWYCKCVCPIPIQKGAIEICKDCNKPIWDTDNN